LLVKKSDQWKLFFTLQKRLHYKELVTYSWSR
jgi:hypothetical protein